MINLLFHLINPITIYFIVQYFQIGLLPTDYDYILFFPFYILFHLVFAYYFKPKRFNFLYRSRLAILQFIFTLLSLSLVASLFSELKLPRLFISTIAFLPVLSYWLISFYFQLNIDSLNDKNTYKSKFRVLKFFTSFILLVVSFNIVLYLKTNGIIFYDWIIELTILLIISWYISGQLTKKFYELSDKNIYYFIAPLIKSHVLFLLFTSAIFFFLDLTYLSRQLIFGTVTIFSIVEIFVFFPLFYNLRPIINDLRRYDYFDQKDLFIKKSDNVSRLPNKLISSLLSPHHSKKVIRFILNFISLNKLNFDESDFTIISTSQPTNFDYTLKKYQKIIINLNHVNDFKHINQMFVTIKNYLVPGGYYIGEFSPLENSYQKLYKQMPKFLFILIYPIHFIFYRIIPKIPILNKVYEFMTHGKGRFLSKAEVFGRLAYCGYKVENTFMFGHRLYFIARSVKTISNDKNPSLGIFVTLDRIGYQNEIIKIYKLRTMHPYSEFLQKDIFEKNNLDKLGKIKDDFRLTSWGKVLRQLWIDELPQIYNWIRGDLSLVGVRALSKHYFSIYPEALQKLRVKIKPGLVPPYYADMPSNFEGILKSEKLYIRKKMKNSIKTDIIYFFQAFHNIVIKGKRSK